MEKEGFDKKGQVRLAIGIAIILFGSIGATFWGLGIATNNPGLSFIGRLITATLPIITIILEKWL